MICIQVHKMVYISFYIFLTTGLKTVFEVETCRVIQYKKYNNWVDGILRLLTHSPVRYNTFAALL